MRYLPLTKADRTKMLQKIGAASVDDLYTDVPKSAFMKALPNLPPHQGELEVERAMAAAANMNRHAGMGPFFLGAGCYYHHVPATVDYIIQRSEFLTAYTPYQPEIAQGTLQVIYEFQSMIALLTGQDVANASMYDGATAAAEAALMAVRITKRNKIVLGSVLHPHYRETVETYLHNSGVGSLLDYQPDGNLYRSSDASPDAVETNDHSFRSADDDDQLLKDAACVIVQSPDFFGNVHTYDAWRKKCDESGALLIVVVTEFVSLGLLPAPASADIVCGEAQSVGLPMSFGGPHLGFFACREKYLRQMPGRLCGETLDASGKRGFVLTLNTREQHIRREKATSNICTNQGLCALAFTVHMALLGDGGFKRLARLNHEAACKLADLLAETGKVTIENETFFNEFTVKLPAGADAAALVEKLAANGIIAGHPAQQDRLVVTATEMTTEQDMRALADALAKELS